MLEVTSAEYVEGYKIRLRFNNGETGLVDLKDSLWGPMFEPLRELSVFKRFMVSDVLSHGVLGERGGPGRPSSSMTRWSNNRVQRMQRRRAAELLHSPERKGGRLPTASTSSNPAPSATAGRGSWTPRRAILLLPRAAGGLAASGLAVSGLATSGLTLPGSPAAGEGRPDTASVCDDPADEASACDNAKGFFFGSRMSRWRRSPSGPPGPRR